MIEMNCKIKHLPPELSNLPQIKAEILYRIGNGNARPTLEGPGLDAEGNFYVCYTNHNEGGFTSIIKIDKSGKQEEFFRVTEGMAMGFAYHPDGLLFFADMMRGAIRVIDLEGNLVKEIFPRFNDKVLKVDCMEFDANGDLWFSDIDGTFYNPIGGIYLLTRDSGYEEVQLKISGLASPNGLAFSNDRSVLWVAESSANRLVRWQFKPDGSFFNNQFSPMATYHGSGRPLIDTIRIDKSGNIYAGIMYGGRFLILDSEGIPIANVLAEGFEEGKLFYTPNLVLLPDEKKAYALASDTEGAYILSFETLDVAAEKHF